MVALIYLIRLIANILTLLIIIDSLLSFVMSPWHPVREFLGRFLTPMLNPIRRVIPPFQSMDFSPLVLIVIIYLVETLLIGVLSRL
jgi:YggT family protein